MRKFLTGLVATAIFAVSGGVALADDYVADPNDQRDDQAEEHGCQQVGDPRAGDNDDGGLGTADSVSDVIRATVQGDECDNSDDRRPTHD